jgi:hypothetical protein
MSGSARAQRMERFLATVGARLGLTEAGRKWLTMAIDPFNDELDNHDGFPDGVGQLNLVEQCRETLGVSAPAGCTTNWDMLVVNLPWLTPVKFYQAHQLSGASGAGADLSTNLMPAWYVSGSGSACTIGGVAIFTAPSANNNWNPCTSTTGWQIYNITPTPQQIAGDYRCTDAGFEVCNSTAELYKQGMVTLFRTPVPTRHEAISGICSGGTFNGTSPAQVINMDAWPLNAQAAFLANNSIQLPASGGCYVPSVINDLDALGYTNFNATQPFIVNGNSSGTINPATGANLLPYQVQDATGVGTWSMAPVAWTNFHMSGALFTGLSLTSTMQVNAKWGIERFPSQNDSVLAPFAHPVPDRDLIALAMYSHIINHMPVGADFLSNGFGDWIQDALGTVSDFIAPVLSAIPHPVAQSLATGVKGLNTLVQGVRQTKRGPSKSPAAQVVEIVEKAAKKPKKKKAKVEVVEVAGPVHGPKLNKSGKKAVKARIAELQAELDMMRFSG